MIYFNNVFIHRNEFAVSASNRAFKYGDGLFESCLIAGRKIPLLKYNIRRLREGMRLLGIHIPDNWDLAFFENIVTTLCAKNDLNNARCKITVWRSGEGLYLPESNEPALLIETFQLNSPIFEINKTGLTIGLFNEIPRLIHPLSGCKTANAIPYVLAANFAKANNFDDVLLLNTEGYIADAISSNIFIVQHNTVYTTNIQNGGVEGTMQAFICDNAARLNIALSRINMTIAEVLGADEVMLTNAISGIKSVSRFQDRTYTNNLTVKLLSSLNRLILHE